GGCMAGWSDCNNNPADGCERNIYQVTDCGGCGTACAVPPNGVADCPKGSCVIGKCNQGFADCDRNLLNGCEGNTHNDVANCGSCGSVCGSKFNQAPTCTLGKCGLGACNQGFIDCNNNLADGCEADVRADAKNCGACGKVCPMDKPFCTGGVCNNILKSCL